MKKSAIVFSLICLIISCGNNDSAKGSALIAQSDCGMCHKADGPGVGPSYQSIADRYGSTQPVTDTLSRKIISGGAGNWGSVPMLPHAAISKEDAKAMVKYILSLKK